MRRLGGRREEDPGSALETGGAGGAQAQRCAHISPSYDVVPTLISRDPFPTQPQCIAPTTTTGRPHTYLRQ